MGRRVAIGLVAAVLTATLFAQTKPPTNSAEIANIHRLILTDGSYQLVRRWEVKGDRVRYISAERNGAGVAGRRKKLLRRPPPEGGGGNPPAGGARRRGEGGGGGEGAKSPPPPPGG